MLEKRIDKAAERIFLAVTDGQIVRKERGRVVASYESITGRMEGVELRETEIAGRGKVKFWLFLMSDGGERYSLAVRSGTGTATAIIQSLAAAEVTSSAEVRFSFYKNGNYTNVNTTADGVPIRWNSSGIPPTSAPDERERYFVAEVHTINDKLRRGDK